MFTIGKFYNIGLCLICCRSIIQVLPDKLCTGINGQIFSAAVIIIPGGGQNELDAAHERSYGLCGKQFMLSDQ